MTCRFRSRLLPMLVFITHFCGYAATAAPTPADSSSQIFEIRTYTTAPGKIDELHERFREHTMKLFERHGMVNIAYWTPQDPTLAVNTLIYVLAHKSRQSAKESWDAFNSDPDWQKVKAASQANGTLVTKVVSVFVEPTDYSPMH